MTAYFYFNDGTNTRTIASEIIKDSFSSTEIYHNNLKPADSNLSFKIPFNLEIANYLKTFINTDVKIQIKEQNTVLHTGYLKKTVDFEKTQKNQPVSLTVVNPTYFLDITTQKSIAMVGSSVSDIIKTLLRLADFQEIGSTVAIPDKLDYFALPEGSNIKETVSELCFEYGFTFDFDNNGYFQIYPLFSDIPEDKEIIRQKFDGSNIREKIKIAAKEHESDYVEAQYNKVELFTNTLLFEDTQNADDNNKCLIEVSAGSFVFDEEKNNLDYDNTNGDVLYVKSITPKTKCDTGLDLTISRFDEDGNDLLTSARMVCKNNTIKSLFIRQLEIYGDAYICSSRNSVVSSKGNKKKEIELKYITTEKKAADFALNLANYYRYANFTIQLKSQLDYKLGSFCCVEDYGTGKFYGRIIQKEYKLTDKSFFYTIETINDYEPAEIEKTEATVSSNRNSLRNGKNGTSYYTWIKYADSPTSGMSDSPDGKKYIGLSFNRVNQNESNDYSDYKWTLIQGENGKDGLNGSNGKDGLNGTNGLDGKDGTTYYTWIKYADTVTGSGMSDDGTNKQFIGIAYNKTTQTESTNPKDYTWSLFRGKDGVDGSDGKSNISIELSNASVVVPADSSGVATKYDRTQTEIHCYEGTKALKYSSKSTTTAGYWWVSISTSGLASGGKTLTASSDGFYATLGNSSAVTAASYSGRRTITINGISTDGTAFTRVAQQTITLALAGEDANAFQISPDIVNLCCGSDGTLVGNYEYEHEIKIEMKVVKDNVNQSFTYKLSNVPDNFLLENETVSNNVRTLHFTAGKYSYVPSCEIQVEATSNNKHYYKNIKLVVSDSGNYLGKLDDPPDYPEIGDYFLFDGSVNSDDFSVGLLYSYDGSEWKTDRNEKHLITGFIDAIEMAENLPDDTKYSTVFKNLTVAVLQVGKMFANQITLMNNGLIQSSNYSSSRGFQINANGNAIFRNGTFNNIMSDNGTFTNATISETCTVKGELAQGISFTTLCDLSFLYDSSHGLIIRHCSIPSSYFTLERKDKGRYKMTLNRSWLLNTSPIRKLMGKLYSASVYSARSFIHPVNIMTSDKPYWSGNSLFYDNVYQLDVHCAPTLNNDNSSWGFYWPDGYFNDGFYNIGSNSTSDASFYLLFTDRNTDAYIDPSGGTSLILNVYASYN